ncbi:MAG: HAMP domain-containing sensor histidine kinase [Aggregatilineales bacterium]
MITKNNAQSLFQAIVRIMIAVYLLTVTAILLIFGLRYTVVISAIAVIVSYGLYRWSFTPNYKRAIDGFIVTSFVFQFLFMFVNPTLEITVLLLLPIFFVHLFYDSRTTLMMIVASLILVNGFALTYINNINPFPIIDLFTRNIFTIGVIGMLFVSTSIRNNNEAEIVEKTLALQENEAFLKQVINNSIMGISLVDLKSGAVTYLNRDNNQGYDLTKYQTASDWSKIVVPEDKPLWFNAHKQVITGKSSGVEVVEVRLKDGDLPLEVVVFYLTLFKRTPTGEPLSMIVSALIVTEQRMAEQRRLELAVQQQKVALMNDLVLAFSHEFRTPLSSIELSLHLLQRQLATPQVDTYIERARLQIARIDRLIKQLTFMVRLEQNLTPNLESINICSIVKQVVAVAQSSADSTDLQITLLLPQDDMTIFGDADLLTRVLQQLLDNAIKYSSKDGQISVTVEPLDADVLISVTDNGIGIPEQVQPRLFERFVRADEHRNKEGLGLGLFIVKKIVEAHAGTVTLTSAKGQGTKMQVMLPSGRATTT